MQAFDEHPISISFCLIRTLRSCGVSDRGVADTRLVADGEPGIGACCPLEQPSVSAIPAATEHTPMKIRTIRPNHRRKSLVASA
ncbi:hypothetical protein AB0H00_02305 [Nocardia sp. NPDC023852]|uniref:hypothetical protein n=1 Tax=Nocardia sp. NPDC023852 TaxID=3154697 RepID=UPI0033CB126F